MTRSHRRGTRLTRGGVMSRLFTSASRLSGVMLGSTLAGAVPASGAIETQTFSSDPAPAGWVGFNNTSIGSGGTFGWSPGTNETQGDPAGEAGGQLSRGNGASSYYADQT